MATATIRRAVTTGPHRVEVRRGSAPENLPGHVTVAVEAVGLCGSDYHLYRGDNPYAHYPLVQGHELAGVVVDAGDVDGLAAGDRVAVEPTISCGRCFACRQGSTNCCVHLEVLGVQRDGGLADLVCVPGDRVHPVGDLPADLAVLVEPLAIGAHVVARAGVRPGDRVVVLGGGPIGLTALLAARRAGAQVLVADRHSNRLEVARSLGAAAVHHGRSGTPLGGAVAAFTDDDGPRVVIDATGDPHLLAAAVDLVAPSGTVAVAGVSPAHVALPVLSFTRKEITVVGSRNSVDAFPAMVEVLRRDRDLLAPLVTRRAPLEAAGDLLEFAVTNPDDVIKAVVDLTA